MLNWLKSLFSNPKNFIKLAVDALDLAVPFLASEIDKINSQFQGLTSKEKAQWIVDKIQEFLRNKFDLQK